MLKFFNRGGKNRPITPKTNREISDDEIESSVSIANEDELEAFANEKKDDGQQAVLIGKNKIALLTFRICYLIQRWQIQNVRPTQIILTVIYHV